jgi:hypothetical protein
MEHAKDLRAILDDPELAELPLGVAGPRIIKPGEEGLIRSVLRNPKLPVLVRNLATWEIANELGCRELVADFSLNLANSISADKFLSMGNGPKLPRQLADSGLKQSCIFQCQCFIWNIVFMLRFFPPVTITRTVAGPVKRTK